MSAVLADTPLLIRGDDDIKGHARKLTRRNYGTTNASTVVEQNLPYNIDGAGVSTWAPI